MKQRGNGMLRGLMPMKCNRSFTPYEVQDDEICNLPPGPASHRASMSRTMPEAYGRKDVFCAGVVLVFR